MSDGTTEGGPPAGSGADRTTADDAGAVAEPLPTTASPADGGGLDADADVEHESVPAAEAFDALGHEVRTATLERLAEAGGRPVSFAELHEATPGEESAGFAYHLRQLTDHFCRKVETPESADSGTPELEDSTDAEAPDLEELKDADSPGSPGGYVLTAAGRRLARALQAGTFTDRVSFGPVGLDDPCPHCEGDLLARGAEGDVAVACGDCGRPVLRLPLPPGGVADRSPAEAVTALDRHHRRRVTELSDGVCPDCGGRVERGLTGADDGVPGDVRATMRCRGCGAGVAAPVTLTVLEHPAVVALYHRHGEDPRERSIWNVGEEWRETVVSREPWLVRVDTSVGGEGLSLYVDGGLDVVGTEQSAS